MEASDLDLVRQARAGDRQAFGVLVERHAPSLYRVAFMMVGNATAAQDVVQETFLGAFEGLNQFRGESAVRTWLGQILARQAARHRRQEGIRKMQSLETQLDSSGSFAGADVAGGTAASDARMDVLYMLDRLPAEFREVLVLRELDGLSYEEIAAALDVPRGTVESRLFRARRALREMGK